MFKCEGCGKEVDHAFLDGYTFGDRMLEGVKFTIKKDENGKLYCSDYPKDSYTIGLNMDHWVQACNDCCDDLDTLQCPECHADIYLDLEEDTEGTEIQVTNMADLFKEGSK